MRQKLVFEEGKTGVIKRLSKTGVVKNAVPKNNFVGLITMRVKVA